MEDHRLILEPGQTLRLSDRRDGAAAKCYRVDRLTGRGGSVLCYAAERTWDNGASRERGYLKEFCPVTQSGLTRRPDGILAAQDGSAEDFSRRRDSYVHALRLLQKRCFEPESLIRNYVQSFELLSPASPDPNAACYLWSPGFEGISLRGYLSTVRENPEEDALNKLLNILKITLEMTRIACCLHMEDLVHQDLKPSNLWVHYKTDRTVDPSHVTLLDVDTVCSVYDRSAVPRGSRGFFANDPQVSIQGDIKSIGAALYYALALSDREFEQPDYPHLPGLVKQSRLLRHAGVSDNGEFTNQLIYILETCLHEAPGMRFRNCAVLQAELEKLLDWVQVYRFDDLDRSLAFVSQSTAGDRLKISLLSQRVFGRREMDLRFHEGRVYLDDEEILSMEHLPLYQKNKALQDLMSRYDGLTEAYYALSDTVPAIPDPREKQAAKRSLLELDRERAELSQQIQQIQRELFALVFRLSRDREDGRPMGWRVREAAALLLAGQFDEALSAVSDRAWELRIRSAKSLREQMDEYVRMVYREVIGERRMLISILKSQGVTAASAGEIAKIYEELIPLAEEERVELDTLTDYAGFLSLQNDLPSATRFAERAKELYLTLPELPEAAYADLLELLSTLYLKQRRAEDAIAAARECLERYQSLARRSPDAFSEQISDACHMLAACLEQAPSGGAEDLREAEGLYQKSLALCRRLARDDPARYEPKLAERISSYATFLLVTKGDPAYSSAEKKYKEALRIYEDRSRRSDREHVYALAYVHYNLSGLYLSRGGKWLEDAERHAREALSRLEGPAAQNPCRFEPLLALVHSALGSILLNRNRLRDAAEHLIRAVEIQMPLAQHDPERESDLVSSCMRLGGLLLVLDKKEDALRLYRAVGTILRRLQEEDPVHFMYFYLVALRNLADLSAERRLDEDAVSSLREIRDALRKARARGVALQGEYRTDARDLFVRVCLPAGGEGARLRDEILELL